MSYETPAMERNDGPARSTLERQIKLVTSSARPFVMPNLEKAADFLRDLPALWSHPGITHQQRESLVKEVFSGITIEGRSLVSVEPKPPYVPLFAVIVVDQGFGYRAFEPPPSPPRTRNAVSLMPMRTRLIRFIGVFFSNQHYI